jgi:XTP/dITP diphosphohydrolase
MQLVFATHNENKFKEVRAQLPASIQLLSLDDIGCHEDIEETADTIEGNAALKANYVRDKYRITCFADDTGLEVDALNGAPGVYSARYAGPENDSQANMDKLLSAMKGVTDRRARFKTAIALSMDDSQEMFLGICEGQIIPKKRGGKGFGYDPIFQPIGYDRTFAEMSIEEKSSISHRGKAMQQLIEYLSE